MSKRLYGYCDNCGDKAKVNFNKREYCEDCWRRKTKNESDSEIVLNDPQHFESEEHRNVYDGAIRMMESNCE